MLIFILNLFIYAKKFACHFLTFSKIKIFKDGGGYIWIDNTYYLSFMSLLFDLVDQVKYWIWIGLYEMVVMPITAILTGLKAHGFQISRETANPNWDK